MPPSPTPTLVLSVAPSIPTQPASFLPPSTPSARLPLIQVSFFNPLLTSCFCPLHGVQSSTCCSGVHHFFHASSPARFPCSCFSLPYLCTFFFQRCPFYSLHPSISLHCGLCASPFSIPPFLLDIHLTSLGTMYVRYVCAVLPNYWLCVCTDAVFPAHFDLPKTPRAFSFSLWLTETTTQMNTIAA